MTHAFGKFCLILALGLVADAHAQALFADDEVLEIGLTGPFSTLLAQQEELSELPFTLHAGGYDYPVEVRQRGKSRRRVCRFPPLRLNLKKSAMSGSVFAGQDKLKLVSHCRNSDAAQLNTLEEYAAYKILTLLTDTAYRVRLVRITYSDSEQSLRPPKFVRYGFIIEPLAQLANRVGAAVSRQEHVSLQSLDEHQAAIVYIFQYLVGNTDWSLVTADKESHCCHNIDLLEADARLHLVPYDFDLAGLVNARYAKPDPSLGLSRVTQRRYRGFCSFADELGPALAEIKSRKAAILQVISDLPALSARQKESRLRFLEKFFASADDEEKLLRSFARRCLETNG